MTSVRNRIGMSAAALAVLSLSACLSEMPRTLPTEQPQPQTLFVPSFLPVVAATAMDPASIAKSNRVKYADAGAQSTVGKTGTVALSMRALLSKDGSTLVEATTGTFGEQPGDGIIDKVLLKTLTANPQVFNDRPGTSEWSHTIEGLIPGDQVSLQANVKGPGVSRIEVINLTATVKRRPDIAVISVNGAAQAYTGDPVTFFAQVSELNGDLGARANCRLVVDGTPADQATGIWVDARGLVTCQFSYVFQATGTHSVSVSALDVEPGDWDLANNTAGTSITIVTPGTPIAFGQLTVEDAAYTYANTSERTGDYPIQSSSGGSEMWSRVTFFGTAVEPVPAPVQRVDARVSTGGTTIYESSLTPLTTYRYVSGGANVECADYRVNGQTATSCTSTFPNGTGSAWFSYGHQSGTVTYYGQTLYCNTFGCNSYTYNGSQVTGWGERYGLSEGSIVRVQLSFIDAQGMPRVSDRSATLLDLSGLVNYDRYSCAPYWDGLGEVCTRNTSSGTRWRGITIW